jgi:hypothetical protein
MFCDLQVQILTGDMMRGVMFSSKILRYSKSVSARDQGEESEVQLPFCPFAGWTSFVLFSMGGGGGAVQSAINATESALMEEHRAKIRPAYGLARITAVQVPGCCGRIS